MERRLCGPMVVAARIIGTQQGIKAGTFTSLLYWVVCHAMNRNCCAAVVQCCSAVHTQLCASVCRCRCRCR